jgi:DNA-binding response OmpR family regulator
MSKDTQGFKFLVADADKHTRKILTDALKARGHRVIEVSDGVAAIGAAGRERPDFVFVDRGLPKLDCSKACRHLKEEASDREIPIAAMTARADDEEVVALLAAGADFHVAKPFSVAEAVGRAEALCRRLARGDDVDPVTLLPGSSGIAREFRARTRAEKPFAYLCADIDNLRTFNESAGFGAGDRLIHFTAAIARTAVLERGGKDDFVGQAGGDDFIIFTGKDKAQPVAARLTELFEKGRAGFYSEEERERGYVMSQTRSGDLLEVPLVSLSIAVVTKRVGSLGEFWQNAIELRSFIKSRGGGQYVLDRRSPLGKRGEMPVVVAGIGDQRDAVRLAYRMEDLGWRFFTANDGATALKLTHRLRPVAVLFDEDLPLIKGEDAVRLMRMNPPTSAIPAVIAAERDPGGDLPWVGKPVDPRELDRRLREVAAARIPEKTAEAGPTDGKD